MPPLESASCTKQRSVATRQKAVGYQHYHTIGIPAAEIDTVQAIYFPVTMPMREPQVHAATKVSARTAMFLACVYGIILTHNVVVGQLDTIGQPEIAGIDDAPTVDEILAVVNKGAIAVMTCNPFCACAFQIDDIVHGMPHSVSRLFFQDEIQAYAPRTESQHFSF